MELVIVEQNLKNWQIKRFEYDLELAEKLWRFIKNPLLGTLDSEIGTVKESYFNLVNEKFLFYKDLKKLIECNPNFFCFKKDKNGQICCFLTTENKHCYLRIVFRNMNTPLPSGEMINANFFNKFENISIKEAVHSLMEMKGFHR
ncbi:hypothetical protein KJ603_02085 [Patescibacteria group bacterium]|nr:hypothetical protein [Patescibacteria group bacterium]